MNYPTLYEGMENGAVRAMQEGLHRALEAKSLEHNNLRNGAYGDKTRMDVNRFKGAYNITPRIGTIFGGGDGSWFRLEPFLGLGDRLRIRGYNIRHPKPTATTIAEKFYKDCQNYVYHQGRPMPSGLFVPEARTRLDCSSTVTLIYKEANYPDPNDRGYDGYGFTGTLWAKGKVVSRAEPDDLIFYGWDREIDAPQHVAIAVGSSHVVSFGSTPPSRPWQNYRSIYGIRRYPKD